VLRRVIGLSGGLLILMCGFSSSFFLFSDTDVYFFFSFVKQLYVFYILTPMDFYLK